MRTGQGVGANGCGSGGAGLRAGGSVQMGVIVAMDERVEAEVVATATDFFDFLFLLTGAARVS